MKQKGLHGFFLSDNWNEALSPRGERPRYSGHQSFFLEGMAPPLGPTLSRGTRIRRLSAAHDPSPVFRVEWLHDDGSRCKRLCKQVSSFAIQPDVARDLTSLDWRLDRHTEMYTDRETYREQQSNQRRTKCCGTGNYPVVVRMHQKYHGNRTRAFGEGNVSCNRSNTDGDSIRVLADSGRRSQSRPRSPGSVVRNPRSVTGRVYVANQDGDRRNDPAKEGRTAPTRVSR